MRSPLESAIRDQLAHYVTGQASLDEFKDWLLGATWTVDERAEPVAMDLTYDIQLSLAEHSSEGFSEAELRDRLRPLLRASVAAS
jgi:hypothetical protein